MRYLLLMFIFFTGCFGPPRITPPEDGGGSGSSIMNMYAAWGYGIGCLCLLLTLFAWKYGGKRIGQMVFTVGISFLVGSYVTAWIGSNMGLVVIVLCLGSLGYLIYIHRKEIAEFVDDLDGDTEKIIKPDPDE